MNRARFPRLASASRALRAAELVWPWVALGALAGVVTAVAVVGGLLGVREQLVAAESLEDGRRGRG